MTSADKPPGGRSGVSPIERTWLDRSPIPMGVLREARFVYVNPALLALIDATWEDIAGKPFLDRVAPEDRPRVGDRHARRVRGEHVPNTYELDIVTMRGERKCVESWVSFLGGGEAIFQLADRTGRASHQEKLASLAHLGVAVQGAPTEEAVFEVLSRGLNAIGIVLARLARRDDATEVVAVYARDDLLGELRKALGEATVIGIEGPGVRDAWASGSAFFDDLPVSVVRFLGGDHRREARAVAEIVRGRGLTRGVLLRIDDARKARGLILLTTDWLLPEDLPACRLFAAQVTAAIDAARALRVERGRNAALTAQTRIAAFARASSDLDALFALGAVELAAVIGCDAVGVHLVDNAHDPRGVARLAHLAGASLEARAALERVPLAGTDLGRVAREAAPVISAPPAKSGLGAALGRGGSVLAIPLSARGRVIGVMSAGFAASEIPAADVELFEAAGAHFAAAIEAQRLFNDLRQSYADLAQAQQKLVQRERLAAIGELAAVVAHEVRNPLGVLFNSFGAFRKLLGDVEGSPRTLLEIMEEEAARLNHIVGDLLDFARPIAPALQRERLEVVLEEAVEAALAKASDRIEVCREIEPLPLVPMDARLLRQALLNVAMNAVNAMPEGGTITLRLAYDEARGAPMAMVSIEDTGPGIAPEVASRIFEPFFTTRATGTGLGLAVVKRIVDGHHGEVTFTTSEGQGTTFTLWLPLEQAPSSRP